MRISFTTQEAVAFDKALRGIKLNQGEWDSLRHFRGKMMTYAIDSRRYQVQITTVNNHWVQTGYTTDDKEAALRQTNKHRDDRFGARIWDSQQLEYVFSRQGTQWNGNLTQEKNGTNINADDLG